MNFSTAVFLINRDCRAVACTYELDTDSKTAPRTIFKTMDKSIFPGDYVVVPTSTRHGMTVCKVVDVDVEVDFDSPTQLAWIVTKVSRVGYDQLLAQEQAAIARIRSAQYRQKRDELAKAMVADAEELKALPLASQDTGPAAAD